MDTLTPLMAISLAIMAPGPDEDRGGGEEDPSRTPTVVDGLLRDTSRNSPLRGAAGQACRVEVVTLQASGGPNWWGTPGYGGAGVSTAIVVEDRVYLVDMADGIGAQWAAAGLVGSPPAEKLEKLEAAFITHLHTDHISGLPVLMAQGSNPARTTPLARAPAPLYGPFPVEGGPPPPGAPPGAGSGGRRGGIEELFASLEAGLAVDLRIPPRSFLRPIEIQLPEAVGEVASASNPFPPMAPFVVHEDARVSVSATLVNHFYPTFAYRFDIKGGRSIVISGDTGRDTNGNLEILADHADLLLLEVILDDPAFGLSYLDYLFGPAPYPAEAVRFAERFSRIHVDSRETGTIASAANVGTLMLHHLTPPPQSRRERAKYRADARLHFSGPVVIARDLTRFCLQRS